MNFVNNNTPSPKPQLPPLIVIGMHRSGTSLIVRLLVSIGVHMGHYLSRDAEAVYFQKLNRKVYQSVGVKWGNVDRLIQAMDSQGFIEGQSMAMIEALYQAKHHLNRNPGISTFFGPHRWKSVVREQPFHWGWKDPRSTITFPIWLRVFPNAKILHVIRNGIDVAISTHRRSLKQQRSLWKRVLQLDYCPITLDFEYCFRLWEKHISFVMDHAHLIPDKQYLEIRYEELLRDPVHHLGRILDFIKVPSDKDRITTACRQIDRSRLNNSRNAAAYLDQIPDLASRPLMQQLGYQYIL